MPRPKKSADLSDKLKDKLKDTYALIDQYLLPEQRGKRDISQVYVHKRELSLLLSTVLSQLINRKRKHPSEWRPGEKPHEIVHLLKDELDSCSTGDEDLERVFSEEGVEELNHYLGALTIAAALNLIDSLKKELLAVNDMNTVVVFDRDGFCYLSVPRPIKTTELAQLNKVLQQALKKKEAEAAQQAKAAEQTADQLELIRHLAKEVGLDNAVELLKKAVR